MKSIRSGPGALDKHKGLLSQIDSVESELDMANAAIGILGVKPKTPRSKPKPNKKLAKAVLYKEMAQELSRQLQKAVTPAQFSECLEVAKQAIEYSERLEVIKKIQD